ncbi:MAG: hypothetical protein JWR15_2232, partial [Prosthecobacter sp.]|nr:hypothetical protein [Prosthecobacter sp.]
MSESTYALEWRGTTRPGYSYSDIEAALASGDLHSLYKINVDGRWLVLRDFLEQRRALRVAPRAENQIHSPALAQPDFLPTLPAPAMQPSPPPPPLQPAMSPMPALQSSKAPKPVWFWPAIILSSTVCLLGIVVLAFFAATSRSSSQRSITEGKEEGKPESKPQEKQGAKSEDQPRQAKFRPFSFTGREIYPSALLATATWSWNNDDQSATDENTDDDEPAHKRGMPAYGDKQGWMGFELEGLKKGAEVTVEITADGFMKPSKWHGTITTVSQDGSALVKPKVMWDFETLIKVHQQRPINVIFSASIDGKSLPDVTETYTMRSLNDCPLYVKWDKKGRDTTDLAFLFAAYVNENHPQVQEILKEALACGEVKQFTGYQTEKPEEVTRQVFAVWNALQRRGIKYSNVTTTPPGDRVVSQSVRFLHESINSRQANCVDGSVLMASVLQKIGIQAYLVLVPHHCFLAFDLVEDSAALPMGLETTMLGEDKITDVAKMELLSMVEQTKENNASIKT